MHFKSKQNVVHFSLIYSCKCAKSLKQKQSSSYGKDDLFCFMFWSFNVGGMTHCSSTWTHTEQPLPSSPVQEQDYEWFTCRTSLCQPGQIPPKEFGQAFFANEAKVKLSAFSQLKSMECDVSEDWGELLLSEQGDRKHEQPLNATVITWSGEYRIFYGSTPPTQKVSKKINHSPVIYFIFFIEI